MPKAPPVTTTTPAAELDLTPEQRAAAIAQATMLADTARKVAAELPLQADVDDFRRVLVAGARA